MKRIQPYAPIIIIFCLALLVRLVYNLTVAHGYFPAYDARYYDSIARNLLSDAHCFCIEAPHSTTDRAPLWPFIIAAIYAITGPINLYARIFFSLLGAGTCILTYLYTRDIFGKRSGFIAGVLAAVYTGLFIYDGWLYSEALYTFLLLAFSYTLYLLQRTCQLRWMFSSGLCLALASLTRPNGFFTLGLVCVWAVVMLRTKSMPWRVVVRGVLIITLFTAGLIAPWTIRNYTIAHIFIPVATGSGVVLVGVYNDTALTTPDDAWHGMWIPGDRIRPPLPPRTPDTSYMGETENRAYALNWIHTNITSMPYLLGLHFINMWKPYTSEDGLPVLQFPTRISSKIVWFMMQYMPIPVIFLAACGLFLTWKKRKELLIVYLTILLTIAQCIVFYGSMRFRAPIEPMLVMLASGVLWWLSRHKTSPFRFALFKEQNSNKNLPAQQASDATIDTARK